MPVSAYFNKPGNGKPGKGAAVLAKMKKRYGGKEGERVFYATVNKMRSGTPAQRAAQPVAPGAALAAARRRRRKPRGLMPAPRANGERVEGASTTTTRIGY